MTIRILLFFIIVLNGWFSLAQEGTVVSVQVEGAKRTKVAYLKSLVTLKSGMELDSLLLDEDISRLRRLPLISHAYYNVFPSSEGNTGYKVVYNVEENFTLIPFANLFSSSNDAFAFRVGLQEFNFLGRGITLGGFYQYDVFNSYGVAVRAPHLFSRTTGLSLSYNDFTTQEPVFFDGTTADYRYNNRGFEVMGLHEFNFKNRIEFGGSLFTEDYKYLSGATNNSVPRALRVDKHLFKLIYNYENIKYYFYFLDGFRSTLNFQYVGSEDSSLPEFLIGFNDFVYFKRVGEKGNWANRLRLGLASNVNTPFAPFTVDNNLNIRGVGNTIDRGTGAIVFNTEYRHTLIEENWFVLQSNVFVDGGSWRNPGGSFSDFSHKRNIRIYPGVGLRFMHKRIFNAIFRIDYGYGITKDASRGLVFGIGQYF
ncbi:BamA/TamA family outer membrane protein [Zobellia russellii]|uniref:outer membrane protein assembly factor n=1 Tax=Zobellia russellii TaxID=248907 RepID=UPI001BFF4B6E|nr:outer membrane protein assembly factor [Zobellia russellii]MBT9187427.1 outer membrane protein assembly factor [Zobellia russellii]